MHFFSVTKTRNTLYIKSSEYEYIRYFKDINSSNIKIIKKYINLVKGKTIRCLQFLQHSKKYSSSFF